jgi:hypothetical protein
VRFLSLQFYLFFLSFQFFWETETQGQRGGRTRAVPITSPAPLLALATPTHWGGGGLAAPVLEIDIG